jgi:dUTP pyrophosphatase
MTADPAGQGPASTPDERPPAPDDRSARPDEAQLLVRSPQGADIAVPVRLLRPEARLPRRAYDRDAAFDLHAAEDLTVGPLGRAVVGTGIALGLPPGLAALTLPRSGLAARHGMTLVNAPGLIDPGYRGEVRLILSNTDAREPFAVHTGDRVAQLLFVTLPAVTLAEADELDGTDRGEQGFGSSGRSAEGAGEGE